MAKARRTKVKATAKRRVVKPKFKLGKVPPAVLAQIVKRFQCAQDGARFYRSCKGAKNVVDTTKPAWPFETLLRYHNNRRFLEKIDGFQICPKLPFEFLKMKTVTVVNVDMSENYFRTVVLPELGAIRAVEKLDIMGTLNRMFSEEELRLLVTAAKPETVALEARFHDPASDILKNVPNLEVELSDSNPLWRTKKIFELMGTRKTLSIKVWGNDVEKVAMVTFVTNWLKGEPTGILEKLSYAYSFGNPIRFEDIEKVVNDERVQSLMMSCQREPDGFILEREGGGLMRIVVCPDLKKSEFQFF